MIIKIIGKYHTSTKEIESSTGIKLGGLYVPDENKINCPNEYDEHKIDLKISKKGNLVAILKY